MAMRWGKYVLQISMCQPQGAPFRNGGGVDTLRGVAYHRRRRPICKPRYAWLTTSLANNPG